MVALPRQRIRLELQAPHLTCWGQGRLRWLSLPGLAHPANFRPLPHAAAMGIRACGSPRRSYFLPWATLVCFQLFSYLLPLCPSFGLWYFIVKKNLLELFLIWSVFIPEAKRTRQTFHIRFQLYLPAARLQIIMFISQIFTKFLFSIKDCPSSGSKNTSISLMKSS